MSTPDATTPPKSLVDPHSAPGRGFWIVMALSLIAVGAVAYDQFARVDAARQGGRLGAASPLPILGEVPDFALVERSGKKFSLGDLRGHVWVADFIFTNCAGPCPVMSRRMGALQMELLRDRMEGVRCVSFTVDPERDTPEALREYAQTRGADPKRWLFLTGEKKPLRDLIERGFKLTVPRTAEEEEELLHSTRFVLVDRRGGIRGYYNVLSEQDDEDLVGALSRDMPSDEKRRLMLDIQSLLREGVR
jgi:cytochrome oxidase Cu insertion factor (SCO1/SenC/PrrC family)